MHTAQWPLIFHASLQLAPARHLPAQDAIELGAFLTAGGQGSVRRATRRADGAPLVVKSVDLSRLGPFDRALARNEAKASGGFSYSSECG